jgi:hypothetical protein
MIREGLDQRDVQRLGGICAKYPASYVILRILRRAGARRVLDVTYGRGRFYKVYRPEYLAGADPVKWDWIVKPDQFHQKTVFQLHREVMDGLRIDVDTVVVDPPRWNMKRYNRRDVYNYLVGTPTSIILHAAETARILNAKHLLLHYNRVMEISEIEHIVEFKWFARYLYTQNKNTSYYILYKMV